ncbi:MAG: hypothetical protein GWN86_00770 [Desulfobacterales bacterium]|nr:hypothetical protein [Desulfobacterales bacterium]
MKNKGEKKAAKAGKEKKRTKAVEMGISRIAVTSARKAQEPVIPLIIKSFRLWPAKGL